MKILVDKNTKVIRYVFEDVASITIDNNMYMVTLNGKTWCYLGTQDCDMIENVTLPEDYETLKYIYQSNEFIINPTWDLIQDVRAKEADPRLTDDPLAIKPFDSWVWNTTEKRWRAPVARPADYGEVAYNWDEDNQAWVAA